MRKFKIALYYNIPRKIRELQFLSSKSKEAFKL